MKFPQYDVPTTMIIFGVTGDLSRKKLLPSLFDMYCKEYLPSTFRVVGFSRNDYSDEIFQKFVQDVLIEKDPEINRHDLDAFSRLFHHQQGTFEDDASYHRLSELLRSIDNTCGQCMNKLFYLAVPPIAYRTIFRNLAESGLSIPCSGNVGWTRVLVEKPFGKDLETAQELDTLLGSLFQEKQIFRIDHYLAKETVQDILAFRFSNTIFEPVWNNQWVEKVEIKLWEDIDIAARGNFYNDVGALRDVGQNHILQMLALVAMEYPGEMNADAVRRARVDVVKNLRLADSDLRKSVIRGQYEGFSESLGGQHPSETETYFKLKTHIENDRWRGVPFYLESGKALKEKKVEIVVTFKDMGRDAFFDRDDKKTHRNRITFSIQPTEKITVRFWSRRPGIVSNVVPQDLSFEYSGASEGGVRVDAYEKVLFDCIAGDQTLFASTDEIAASWSFITPILKSWHHTTLETYARGYSGFKREL